MFDPASPVIRATTKNSSPASSAAHFYKKCQQLGIDLKAERGQTTS